MVGAGDISSSGKGDAATQALLATIPGTVFTLGDNVYDHGTAEEFATYYAPTWGVEKARTRPVPGNHDYDTPEAAAYFGYFGSAAGDPAKGYYSYDLGAWHVIVLNANCGIVSCAFGSPQEQWLRGDLDAHLTTCTVALWHQPRFSSGNEHGNDPAVAPFWDDLYAANAELVLNGHDHDYERFAPQTPAQVADDSRGVREFVVGTGGVGSRGFKPPQPNSEVRESGTWGVLKLTLRATAYDWQFVPVAGESFTDSGHGACH